MLTLKKYLFLISFCTPLFLFAVETDSLSTSKKNKTAYFFDSENFRSQFENTDSLPAIDFSLNDFHNYLNRYHLGNSGLPFNSLFPVSFSSNADFNFSKNYYSPYFFTPKNVKFYDTHSPYTDLMYIAGSKKEQIFKMTFSYNVKKNWNLTAYFNRIRSEGFYSRQNTNNNSLAISTNYKSLNNRYYCLGSVIYNAAKHAENGGVVPDSVIVSTAPNLSTAQRSHINRQVFIKQYFNLGEKSTDTAQNNIIMPSSAFVLTSFYEKTGLKYEDKNPTSGFYSDIYFDSTKTFDSITTEKIENELAWKTSGNVNYIGFGAGVKHQYVYQKQNGIDTTFNAAIFRAEIFNSKSNNNLWWNVIGKLTLGGYNNNNYSIVTSVKKDLGDSLNTLILKAGTELSSPDYIYNHYTSNHFRWINNFSEMQETRVGLSFLSKKIQLSTGVDFLQYNNFLYFDYNGKPRQHYETIPVWCLFLTKNFVVKNWHLNNKINYQYLPVLTAIRLPEYILEHALYYESDLFKNAMQFQVGASIFYNASYYANSYMPATGQFYLQNNKKMGNYPFVDFFINARIKSVRVFFKIDHLNAGMSGIKYALTPNYPQNGRAFKLGVSWRFFD